MTVSEFLRALMDVINNKVANSPATQGQQPVVVINNASQGAEPAQQEVPDTDNVGQFVPPLQTKIELLKKSAAVDSVYNPDDTNGETAKGEEKDELDVIKKNAGIPQRPSRSLLTQMATDDDGPFEG